MAKSASGDRAEVFGQAVRARGAPESLRALRTHREDIWVSILELAQTVPHTLAAEIDEVAPETCHAFRDLIAFHLSPSGKTPEDLIDATRMATVMGCNPFEGLEPLGGGTLDGDLGRRAAAVGRSPGGLARM